MKKFNRKGFVITFSIVGVLGLSFAIGFLLSIFFGGSIVGFIVGDGLKYLLIIFGIVFGFKLLKR